MDGQIKEAADYNTPRENEVASSETQRSVKVGTWSELLLLLTS